MADDKHRSITVLEGIQMVVTTTLAVFSFRLNGEVEQARATIAQTEVTIKGNQEERQRHESAESLRFKLFEQVTKAIKDGDAKFQLAAASLVTSLLDAEDPLRRGFLSALNNQAAPAAKVDLSKWEQEQLNYQRDQSVVKDQVQANERRGAQPTTTTPLRAYFVDVFYCTGPSALENQKRAQAIHAHLSPFVAKSRVRELAASLNASPGYGVAEPQVRYNADEWEAANSLHSALMQGSKFGSFQLRLVKTPTPGYMSVFAC